MNFKEKQILYPIILVLILIGLIYIHKNLEIAKKDLQHITGTLCANPKFEIGDDPYMEIKLKELRNRSFLTDDYAYHVLRKDLIKKYLINGSKVDIYIRSQKSKSWVDDINRASGGYDIISLNDNSNQYISLKDYNDYRKDDFWLFYIVWLGIVGYFIRWVITNSRN